MNTCCCWPLAIWVGNGMTIQVNPNPLPQSKSHQLHHIPPYFHHFFSSNVHFSSSKLKKRYSLPYGPFEKGADILWPFIWSIYPMCPSPQIHIVHSFFHPKTFLKSIEKTFIPSQMQIGPFNQSMLFHWCKFKIYTNEISQFPCAFHYFNDNNFVVVFCPNSDKQ